METDVFVDTRMNFIRCSDTIVNKSIGIKQTLKIHKGGYDYDKIIFKK